MEQAINALNEILEKDQFNPAELLEIILFLENQQQRGTGVQDLAGNWQLIWTTGTKNAQKLVKIKPNQTKKINQMVMLKVDAKNKQVINQVNLSFLRLSVIGYFDYTAQKRLEFIFNQMQFKMGNLPSLSLPLGKAAGWLQTTYLDDRFLVERGNKGGISLYVRTC